VTNVHEDLRTFMISCSVILRMRNVSSETCKENQNTFDVQNLFPKIVPFME